METHRELFLEYESRDELVHAFQEVAISEGFCIRILHSSFADKVRLCCDRQGKSTSTRKQKLTKRVGCTFELLAKKHALTGKWRFVRRTGDHNHAFNPGPRFHKMTHAQREHRAQLVKAGMKTIDQMAFLRKTYPTLLITYRDLINDDVRLKTLAQQQLKQELGLSSGERNDGDGGVDTAGNGDDDDDYFDDEVVERAVEQQQQQSHLNNASQHPTFAAPPQQQQQQPPAGRQHPHNNNDRHPAFSSSHATTNPANHPQHQQPSQRPPVPTAHTTFTANYSQQHRHLHLPQRAPVQMPPRAPRFLSPSPLQKMLETLQSFSSTTGAAEYVYTYKVEREPSGPSNVDRITHLFVAHRKSLELAREFHDVLSIELSKPHKTGKGMPLLLCSSQTPFNVPFLCAGVFVDTLFKRRVFFKADYKWALNAIEGALCMGSENGYCVGNAVSVLIGDTSDEPELLEAQKKTFPNANLIVSRTRMKKALGVRWRQHFPTEQQLWEDMVENYEALCDAPTSDAFEEKWGEFQTKEFASSVPGFLAFVEDKLLVYKEKFMAAWVDDQLHLGTLQKALNGSSFWTHAVKKKTDSVLKKFRPRHGIDLMKLWRLFDADMERQYWDVRRCHSDEETFRLLSCDEHLYSQVNYRIASRALSLVHEYIEAIQAWAQGREHEMQHSEKHFASMGLPSFSVIRDRVFLNTPFELSDFHRFWRIERVDRSNELATAAALPVSVGAGPDSSQPLSPFDEAISKLRERFFTVTPLMQTEILAQINRITSTSTSAPAYPLPAAAASTIVPVVPTTTRKRIRPRTTNQVRLCSLCNETGHNSRSCHIRLAFEQIQEQQHMNG